MTTEVNQPLTRVEGLFKSLVWDNVVSALMIQVPILRAWPISVIVLYITNQLYALLQLGVDLADVPFLNAEHEKAFNDADVELRIIAQEKGIDSDEFKKAREDAKVALSRFVIINR